MTWQHKGAGGGSSRRAGGRGIRKLSSGKAPPHGKGAGKRSKKVGSWITERGSHVFVPKG